MFYIKGFNQIVGICYTHHSIKRTHICKSLSSSDSHISITGNLSILFASVFTRTSYVTCRYDWVQNILWRWKYNVKGYFPLPILGTIPFALSNVSWWFKNVFLNIYTCLHTSWKQALVNALVFLFSGDNIMRDRI